MKKSLNVTLIAILRFLSALPFAVYYSSLQLYLLHAGFHKNTAISIVGSVLALSFGLSLIGGYLGSKYISYKSLFLISIIFVAIGCLTFISYNHISILWFSGAFLVGNAGLTVSLNMILTQHYEPLDSSRERAFFWLYMSLNIGYLLGYSFSGYYGNSNAYYKIPIVIFISTILSIVLCLWNWNKIDTLTKPLYKKNVFIVCLNILVLLIGCHFLLKLSELTNITIIVSWLSLCLFGLYTLTRNYPAQKTHIITFYILMLSSLVFWSLYFLAPMALIVFIKFYVNLKLNTFLIAPQWMQNINAFIVILGSLFLGTRKKPLTTFVVAKQFSLGLLLIGCGFACLAIGIILTPATNKVAIYWVVLSYIIQSAGELFIGPIGFALVGRLIPKQHQSFMTGIWVAILGVASAIASKLSILAPHSTAVIHVTLKSYIYYFSYISIIALTLAIVTYALVHILVKPKLFV